jgi:hypothetical protein
MNNLVLQFGKLLVFGGIALIVIGGLLMLGSKFSFFGLGRLGRLPGDIAYRGKTVSFYFPLATCILLSAAVTLILWLLSLLGRR